MRVRYLTSILSPEEHAGPLGSIHDIPSGPWLDKLLAHRYVEELDPSFENVSRDDLIDEIKRLRAERDQRNLIDEVKQLITEVKLLEEPSGLQTKRLELLADIRRLMDEVLWYVEPEPHLAQGGEDAGTDQGADS